MVDKSGPTHLREIVETALQAYEEHTGVTLAKDAQDSLAIQVQNCDSVDAITAMLQGQAKAFAEFCGRDGVLKSVENIALILSRVFVTASESLGDAIGLVRQNVLVARSMALTLFYSHSHL